MKKFYLFSLLVLLTLGMTGCRYEEGPFISFLPKADRLGNTWVVNTVSLNGTSGTSIDGFKEITFFNEGGCQIIYNPLNTEIAYSGTWAFSDDKKIVQINTVDELFGVDRYESDWTILALKDEVLKVTFTDDGDVYIVEFKPAA